MKKETKKQLFAIFVLLTFVGSSLAYAVSVVLGRPPIQEQAVLISDKPFTNSEVESFFAENVVVADFYYAQDCAKCGPVDSAITGLAQELSGYLAVDKIDAEKYKIIADANDIAQYPTLVLKGISIDTVSGEVSKQELKGRICQLYAEPIAACE